MAEYAPPPFPFEAEALAGTLASISATQGDAGAVAVLATSIPQVFFVDSRSDWGNDYYYFELRLLVSADLYGRLGSEREALCTRLSTLAGDVTRAHDQFFQLSSVIIAPTVQEIDGWRAAAEKWLRGEGINNQGGHAATISLAECTTGCCFDRSRRFTCTTHSRRLEYLWHRSQFLCVAARRISALSQTL